MPVFPVIAMKIFDLKNNIMTIKSYDFMLCYLLHYVSLRPSFGHLTNNPFKKPQWLKDDWTESAKMLICCWVLAYKNISSLCKCTKQH